VSVTAATWVSYLVSPFILRNNMARLDLHGLHSISRRINQTFSEWFKNTTLRRCCVALTTLLGIRKQRSKATGKTRKCRNSKTFSLRIRTRTMISGGRSHRMLFKITRVFVRRFNNRRLSRWVRIHCVVTYKLRKKAENERKEAIQFQSYDKSEEDQKEKQPFSLAFHNQN